KDILESMSSPMGRMGQPREMGAAYVFLACQDSSFVTGQTLHINGGMITNG
ncbi:MAG TPA: NAD(P)-dependent oxidoreductase, partial [Psychrobacter sp.]|nr:NAD(P)-dependent oxidoreductase [Psychrobacter sp.]